MEFLTISTFERRDPPSRKDDAVRFQKVEKSFRERFDDSGSGREAVILGVPRRKGEIKNILTRYRGELKRVTHGRECPFQVAMILGFASVDRRRN